MNTQVKKFRHITPAFFYVAISTLVVTVSSRWLLSIQWDLVELDEDVWEIWFPMVFTWIPIFFLLRPKLQILDFKKDNGRFILQMLVWLSIAISTICAQSLLTTSTSDLVSLKVIEDANNEKHSRYYQINTFDVVEDMEGIHVDVSTSGRGNTDMNFRLYATYPFQQTIDAQTKYFFGIQYYKRISNRLSQQEKESEYNKFVSASIAKLKGHNFQRLNLFEVIPKSEKLAGFLQAIAQNQPTKTGQKAFILEPYFGDFDSRNEGKLEGLIISLVIGLFLFLLISYLTALDKFELEQQQKGKMNIEMPFSGMGEFLVPGKNYFTMPIIINLNILVFIILIFNGVDFIQASGGDLLEWGANRRLETLNGDWWRLISSMFLHAGIMHLILNLYGLIMAALFLEPMIGRKLIACLYFISGVCGSIASIGWYENTISVGASGAIFGLYGALLALIFTKAFPGETKGGMLMMFGPYVAISLLMGLTGGIDNAAHLGGLFSGAILGLIIYSVKKVRLT